MGTANSSSMGTEEPLQDLLEVFRSKEEYIVGAPQQENPWLNFTFLGSMNLRMCIAEDLVESDGSSDLFEIESFST